MRSAAVGTAAGSGQDAGVWARRLEATCLVLFPLLFLIVAGTDLHPSPSGETTTEQVRTVAASAGAWRIVHLVLAGASLLGMGAVLGLRRLIPTSGRLSIAASIAAALGVAAAGLVAGTVLMEAVLVAPAAKACAVSSPCLSLANQPFLSEFADASWNDVAHLSYAAGTLTFSLATLAVLGWMAKTVRAWEALAMVVGVVGIYATNTALHGDAKYGLALVLVASASIALRMEGAAVMNERREAARRFVQRKRRFYTILVVYLALCLLWFAIDLLTGTDDLWFYWPVLGAGLIVAVIGIAMFGIGGLFGADWERRQVDKYLERRGEGENGANPPAQQQ